MLFIIWQRLISCTYKLDFRLLDMSGDILMEIIYLPEYLASKCRIHSIRQSNKSFTVYVTIPNSTYFLDIHTEKKERTSSHYWIYFGALRIRGASGGSRLGHSWIPNTDKQTDRTGYDVLFILVEIFQSRQQKHNEKNSKQKIYDVPWKFSSKLIHGGVVQSHHRLWAKTGRQ